jgi:hypothetical protein
VPAATQVNSEAINLEGVHTFILRQILCARLHHVSWPLILAANIAMAVSFVICVLLALVGAAAAVLSMLGVANEAWKLTAFAIIPALNCAGQLAALAVGDHLVRKVVAAPSPPRGPKVLAAAAIALGSATYALAMAPFTRSFEWRGIIYDIEGRDRIRMRSYAPFRGAIALKNSRRDHRLIARSGLFDRDFYLAQKSPESRSSDVDPISHYLQHGAARGYDPNPLFDSDWYLSQNEDVRAAGINPLIHYILSGAAEGRDPSPLFDTDRYLEQHPDVRAKGINPLGHYLRFGIRDGLKPHVV